MREQVVARNGTPLDERDAEIYHRRCRQWEEVPGPRIGDFVEFADGVLRRISHIWGTDGFQSSAGGSFYFGGSYMTFSGQLFGSVPLDTLVDSHRIRQGPCWFFHHDFQTAGGGIDVNVWCRIYRCWLVAPR